MGPVNFRPKTRPVRANKVAAGDVVLEKPGWPCKVHRVRTCRDDVTFYVTYTWQEQTAPSWPLGPFPLLYVLRKAVR